MNIPAIIFQKCLRSEIGKFLSEQKNYTAKKGRSTINFGESYDNSIKTEIPETLQKLINLTSDKTINSVTLTRYTGVDNLLPQHILYPVAVYTPSV